jgi:MGT family glycosyltransferase
VSFGTVLGYMSRATGVFRAVLDALDGLPVRALLTVGRRFDPALLAPVPPNVRVEAWVDQADVLGQVDLVVCHGGSGTVLGALTAGVPIVVVPVFADQFANASRVADCGAGVVVVEAGASGDERNMISVDAAPRIADAISTVLADRASYRSAALHVAEDISSSPLPADLLNRFLRQTRDPTSEHTTLPVRDGMARP